MVYNRGQKADFDHWAQRGNRGWGYTDVLPYFKRTERRIGVADDRFHGREGNLPVTTMDLIHPVCEAFIDGAVALGMPRHNDYNSDNQAGVGYFQRAIYRGWRHSAARVFLHPARARGTLDVRTDARAAALLFEGTRAVGVHASQLGQSQELRAEREVILCAGAYNSPQLLMLSGVGPAEHLTMREIEVLLDQPAVGENLSDHPAAQLVWITPEPQSLLLALEPAALEQYEATQTGPFASNLAEAGGFARIAPDAPAPDIQFHVAPVHIVDEGMSDPQGHGVWASPCLLTEHSRGSVRLASNDPSAKPIVHNAFYSAGDDLQRMIAGLRLTLEICAQPAMKPYCAEPFTTPDGDSDDALRAHVARTTFAVYHPVGTCRMGQDAGAVVDEQLRVNGVDGLRVVDASVMPVVPRGNTNAPTIAIAERAADLLRHGRALAEPSAALSAA
jgi:choline dehydrogenase-like flavoprotein